MKSFKVWILIIMCLALGINSSYANVSLCPPHPDLLKRLKKEGKLSQLQEILAKKSAYIDRPQPITKPLVGTKKVIVLLVDFSDKVATTTQSYYTNLLFSLDTSSLRKYYQEVSYYKLDVQGAVSGRAGPTSGWYRAPQTYSYYTNGQSGLGYYPRNAQKLVEDAITLADRYVDFADYDSDGDGAVDALCIVHAGPGAEVTGSENDIWSHMGDLYPLMRVDGKYITTYIMCPEDGKIGVFAHEMGHILGLPDLYDTDNESSGIGDWSLMASGNWNNNGKTPAHPDAWSKIQMGWVTPQTVTTNMDSAQIPQVETSPTIYKLWKDGLPTKEYFLVENRQKVRFDSYLPGSGLLIYHIDEKIKEYYLDSNEWNAHEWYPPLNPLPYNHYLVALEQADGRWDLEKNKLNMGDVGDPYYGDKVFNDYSTPNSKAYNDSSTSVGVTNISNSQAMMTASLWITLQPYPFSLLSPADRSETKTLSPIFEWGTTTAYDGGTVTYIIYYGTDSTFNTSATKNISVNTFSTTLVDNSTYYWKVKAVDKYGATRWSSQTNWKFYVNLFNEPPGTPTLTWPPNRRVTCDLTPTFRWSSVSDPDPNDKITYKLMYSKDADFTSKVEATITTTSYTPDTPLDNNSTYYWKVAAIDNHGSETPCLGTFTLMTRKIIIYPNPFYPKDNQITFAHLPDNSTIKIFTISGELVRRITADNVTGEAQWRPVGIASGIYLYVIESEGEIIEKGKLGILR